MGVMEVERELEGRSRDGDYIVEETRPKADAYHDITRTNFHAYVFPTLT